MTKFCNADITRFLKANIAFLWRISPRKHKDSRNVVRKMMHMCMHQYMHVSCIISPFQGIDVHLKKKKIVSTVFD